MFTPLGLFKNVECPNQDQCKLLACIFLHDNVARSSDPESLKYDPLSVNYEQGPIPKRLKAEHKSSVKIEATAQPALVKPEQPEQPEKPNITKSEANRDGIGQTIPEPSTNATNIASRNNSILPILPSTSQAEVALQPVKATQPTIPPTKKVPSNDGSKKSVLLKKEELIPRSVPSQPVQFGKRDEILKKFYAQLQSKNKITAGGDSELKKSMLSEQELIKYSLDFEQEAATRFEGTVYQSHIGRQMVLLKKMSADQWKSFVRDIIRKKVPKPEQGDCKPSSRLFPGLESPEEEVLILRAIRTSLAGLENFGYITTAPTAQQIASAKLAVEASAGWEECNRCNTRFRVFPGRDEEGRLTSGGKCRYHWARPNRPQVSKADRIAGGGQISHSCCGQSPGSDGCTVAESHVFCVKDPSRLASILQFESTPANGRAIKGAVSFDCEMGYTTLGMEVIRVTAVSWPAGKELLDFLVRPYGEILDFNTRFSGVTQKQFTEAAPHGGRTLTDTRSGALSKVESPTAARKLLFDLIGPETPLIGHAIDNDLNTLRIIHPLVIDTVLLYPHPKGLPARFSLKLLAKQHLDRNIQTSGADGHDSKEDAITTGDLVTLKLQDKWKQMQTTGWKVEKGKLVAPQIR